MQTNNNLQLKLKIRILLLNFKTKVIMMKQLLFSLLFTSLLLSSNAQTIWTQIENPEEENTFTGIVSSVDGSLYGGVKGVGLHRSDDNGKTWNEITNGQYKPDWNNARLLGNGSGHIFSAVYNRSYSSSDKGANWKNINQNSDQVNHIFQFNDYLYMLTTEGYIYRSDDAGDSWSEIVNGLPDPEDQNPANYNTFAIMGSTLFVGEYGGKIYKTKDHGDTWSVIGKTNRHTPFITAVGDVLIAAHTGSNNTSLYISNDEGDSWTKNDDWEWNNYIGSITTYNGVVLMACNDGLHYSTDKGNTWNKSEINVLLEDATAKSVIVDKNKIFVTYSKALDWFAYSIDYSQVVKSSSINTASTIDYNIYPNPSSDFVNIELKTEGLFNLIIVNALGQVVHKETINNNSVMPLNNLNPGSYTFILFNDNAIMRKTLIKN